MFFVPAWVTNFTLLGTCFLAGYQHSRLNHENRFLNLQFLSIILSLLLVVAVVFWNRWNPWLSLVFLMIAIANMILVVRQQRLLPPTKIFE